MEGLVVNAAAVEATKQLTNAAVKWELSSNLSDRIFGYYEYKCTRTALKWIILVTIEMVKTDPIFRDNNNHLCQVKDRNGVEKNIVDIVLIDSETNLQRTVEQHEQQLAFEIDDDPIRDSYEDIHEKLRERYYKWRVFCYERKFNGNEGKLKEWAEFVNHNFSESTKPVGTKRFELAMAEANFRVAANDFNYDPAVSDERKQFLLDNVAFVAWKTSLQQRFAELYDPQPNYWSSMLEKFNRNANCLKSDFAVISAFIAEYSLVATKLSRLSVAIKEDNAPAVVRVVERKKSKNCVIS